MIMPHVVAAAFGERRDQRDGVRHIVVPAGAVIDAVTAGATDPALQADQLREQAI